MELKNKMEELKFNGEDILVFRYSFSEPKGSLMERAKSIINMFPNHKVLFIPNEYAISVMKIEDVKQIIDKITEYIEECKKLEEQRKKNAESWRKWDEADEVEG